MRSLSPNETVNSFQSECSTRTKLPVETRKAQVPLVRTWGTQATKDCSNTKD